MGAGFFQLFCRDRINARLVKIMKTAFAAVWQVAQEKRSAAQPPFIVACQRILHTRELRGLYSLMVASCQTSGVIQPACAMACYRRVS
jgi:hypothetical protein